MSDAPRSLRCPGCGAPMRADENFRARCEHCGAEVQMPRPAAPAVDTSRIVEAVGRTTSAADRIAAEMAIPRLQQERHQVDYYYQAACQRGDGIARFKLIAGLAAVLVLLAAALVWIIAAASGGGIAAFLTMSILLPAIASLFAGVYYVAVRPTEEKRRLYVAWAEGQLREIDRRLAEAYRTVRS